MYLTIISKSEFLLQRNNLFLFNYEAQKELTAPAHWRMVKSELEQSGSISSEAQSPTAAVSTGQL